jgi:hypothetical protein
VGDPTDLIEGQQNSQGEASQWMSV